MNKRFDAVAVGMINFDVNVLGCTDSLFSRKVTEVRRTTLSLGGDAQNCAFTMVHLGLKTALCGAVGQDMAGDICLTLEKQAGIDTVMVTRKSNQTGIAVQLLKTSEAAVLDCTGANAGFGIEDIPDEFYGCARVLSLNSFFGCGTLGAAFLSRAKDSGMITVADTTTLSEGDSLLSIRAALPYVDYFVPSYAEAKLLAGGDERPETITGRFLDLGVKNVVIKLGSEGCYIATSEGGETVTGYRMDNVVDTTGCGDNFVAGFIAGLCHDLPLKECAQYANAAGAINTQALGSNGAVQSYAQLTEFIRRHEGYKYLRRKQG